MKIYLKTCKNYRYVGNVSLTLNLLMMTETNSPDGDGALVESNPLLEEKKGSKSRRRLKKIRQKTV